MLLIKFLCLDDFFSFVQREKVAKDTLHHQIPFLGVDHLEYLLLLAGEDLVAFAGL